MLAYSAFNSSKSLFNELTNQAFWSIKSPKTPTSELIPVIKLVRSSICLFRILYLFSVFFSFVLASSNRRVVYLISSFVFSFFLRKSSSDWPLTSPARNEKMKKSKKLLVLVMIYPAKFFGYSKTNLSFFIHGETSQVCLLYTSP